MADFHPTEPFEAIGAKVLKGQTSSFFTPASNGKEAPIPGSHDNRLGQVDPEPTLTAAGHGSLTARALTAMGRLPKVRPATG